MGILRQWCRRAAWCVALVGTLPCTVRATPLAVPPFTLVQCVERALLNNAKIRAGDFAVRGAEAVAREARAGGWPVFEYESQTAPVPQDAGNAVRSLFRGDLAWHARGKVNIGVPLYSFGKLRTVLELATRGIDAARDTQAQEEGSVVVKVHQLYYGIQLAGELRRLLGDAIRRVSEKLAEAPADVAEEGAIKQPPSISPVDRLRLRVFRAELERRLAEVRVKEELAREGLRIQMDLPAGTAVRLAATRLQPMRRALKPLAVYQEAAITRRPEARLLATGVAAKRLQVALERKKPLPDVGVGGFFEIGRSVPEVQNLAVNDDFTNPFHFTRAGIGLQLKGKFDPHGQRARVTKIESEYLKASTEAGIAKEGLQLEVREAYLKAREAFAQIRRAEATNTVARQLLFLTKSNLDLGIGEKAEYTDALQLTLQSEAHYYEAVFALNSAMAELDQKAGLTPTIETLSSATP